MSEITHADYMSLVERIEKLEGKVEALSKYVDKQLQEKYFGNYEEGRNWAVSQNTTFADHVHPRSSAYGPYNSKNLITIAGDPYDDEVQRGVEKLLESLGRRNSGETKCFFETLSPEDRNKPVGISPCRKCSPYSLGGQR